ncbi:hypothetical protein [Vulcanisaeta thermophila]|uniref:hypothetical protein n=1 Tax=Vulcanisaeta thermophila TaxID=867917 RepID=UPI0008533D00|nr:hypothetical protein [Vulcanisaeta thermophila]
MRLVSWFWLASLMNLADLITSYFDFTVFGLGEVNAFALLLHLSNYLAALMAVVIYQVLVLALYLITIRRPLFKPLLMVFALFKVIAVVNNILVIVGFNELTSLITKAYMLM